MSGIQEVAEALIKLTAKEVNELSHILNNGDQPLSSDMERQRYELEMSTHINSPKLYGTRLINKRYNRRK